jgi:membrane protein
VWPVDEPPVDERPEGPAATGLVARARQRFEWGRELVQSTILWRVWERMLETEFVDRSVALAGKAFVSFFPLVIVVAAFLPERMRASVFASLTSRLGLSGNALDLTRSAFQSADDIKQATGILGLVTTFFFASSFTTALQRVYLRAWRRPPGLKVGSYTRGLIWLVALLGYMTASGGIARSLGRSAGGLSLLAVLFVAVSVGWWWFTAWYLLLGHVRWRPLLPTAVITSVAMGVYAVSASIWMPEVVKNNQNQFGFFGIALALVTWFSGASVCIIVGACAGPVLVEDRGVIGRICRGREDQLLVEGALPSLDAPVRSARLRDAFSYSDSDVAHGD